MSMALPNPSECCSTCGPSECGTAVNFSALVEQELADKLCVYSVKDNGAVGDGVSDDTAAIQATLALGGITVFPCGHYRITSQISIPANAILFGCLPSGRSYFGNTASIDGGSWIDVDVAAGSSTNPSLLLAGDNIRLENLAFLYPGQLDGAAVAGAVVVFPPTVGSNHQVVSSTVVKNCYWWNAYIALDLYGVQKPTLTDLGIGAVYRGVILDYCKDYPFLSRIQVHPYFQPNGTPNVLRAFMESNCRAFSFGDVDALSANQIACFGVAIGIHCFIGHASGNCWGQIDHFTLDASQQPIKIDESSSFILSFDHGTMVVGNSQSGAIIPIAVQIDSPSSGGVVRLSNLRLVPYGTKFAKVGVQISGGFVFIDSHYSWCCGYGGPDYGAIMKVTGGTVTVSDTILRRLGGVPDVTQFVSAFDVSGGTVFVGSCTTFYCAYDLNLSGGTVQAFGNQFQSANVTILKTGGTLIQGANTLGSVPVLSADDVDPTKPNVITPFITPDINGFVEFKGKGQTVATLDTTALLGGIVVKSLDSLVGSGGTISFGSDGQLWAALKALLVDGTDNSEGDVSVCLRAVKTDALLTEIARFVRQRTLVFPALPAYVDNAAAGAALPVGALYHKTGDLDTVSIVH